MQSTPCEKFGECVFCAHYVSANACVQCRMSRQYLPTRQSISNRGWPVQVYNPSVTWVRANSLSVRFVAPSGRPGRSGNGRAWGKSERPHCKQLRRGFATSSYRSLRTQVLNPLTWITERILLSGRHRNGRDSLLRCLCAVLAASFRTPYLDFKAKMPCQKRALSPLRGVRMKVLDLSSRYHQI